jgi:hypothetical protein
VKTAEKQIRSENRMATVYLLQGGSLLGAFGKLRKVTFSFVMYVRPSFRMEQLRSQWADFYEISYLSIF